ncbi:hypothetical protein BEP19_03235 [Ammoniphilus oxalaticus]|uniref:Rad50/SbcC-type AAA domain-containing protein n=1 Tax=Ammoniphilus oxalaticus TaxID=66863 RepID=A0A419SNY1_9BACL|nr:hypothetical protein [Ammoniphilus oxalaticus]RKD25952.1 hypothetical protein BEP19_03235 [Ammoniphilus oxalaticus]
MYPVKMKIGGIRDISPVIIDLGDKEDLALFGGVNGSGKSTISFAAAYALGSDQISVDTLRSKSLDLFREIWQAHVEIIFHNPQGPDAIDAPEWVSLGVEITQKPNQQAFSKFFSKHGDAIDELSLFRQFKTRVETREEFELKYGVSPDKFFMFWYQNSITRFATMKDRERFEYVAEMYGLKDTQERWERAKFERKIAQEDFDRAKINLERERQRIVLAQKSYKMWESRNKLRKEGVELKRSYLEEKKRLLSYHLDRLEQRLASLNHTRIKEEREVQQREETIEELTEAYNWEVDRQKKLQEEKRIEIADRDQANQLLEQLRQEREELEKVTKEIEEKYRYVRSAEILNKLNVELEQELQDLSRVILEMEDRVNTVDRYMSTSQRDNGKWENVLRELQDKIDEWTTFLQNSQYDELKRRAYEVKEEYANICLELKDLLDNMQTWSMEQLELKRSRVVKIPLQVKSIGHFKNEGFKAFAFGELFEILANQDYARVESLLSGIKHSVFVCGPINESVTPLLHVSLQEGLTRKKAQGLFRKKLPGKPLNQFLEWNKVTYDLLTTGERESLSSWVEQIHVITREMEPIYVDRGESYLLDGQLHGPLGQSGAFAEGFAIGRRAWQKRFSLLKSRLVEGGFQKSLLTEKEKGLELQWYASWDELKLYEERVNQLPIIEKEREMARQTLDDLDQKLKHWGDQKSELSVETRRVLEKRKEKELQIDKVLEELEIHRQFGEMSVKLDRLREVRSAIEEKGHERDQMSYQINEFDRSIEQCSTKMTLAREKKLSLNNEIVHLNSALQKIEDEHDDLQREINGMREEEKQLEQEEAEFNEMYSELIQPLPPYEPLAFDSISEARLRNWADDSRRKLDEALSMSVDEFAEEKYFSIRDSFQKSQHETTVSETLFQRLLVEEEELRNHFRKTVHDRYQRINLHFSDYINRIGFRGRIEQIEPDEVDPRRQHYEWRLYIATKAGHDLEYLRPTESIRQKISSAPSGGEMAVISLVFALALLTDIEKRPPFYLLDEFDSALDEWRKGLVIDMYQEVLQRKLIIISPKSHSSDYLERFGIFYAIVSDQKENTKPISRVLRLERQKYQALSAVFEKKSAALT